MKLSGCVIMRDAAADLVDCLESMKDGVDELVIVDTGSKDNSMEIARRYTDKVYSFAWRDDFSAARNYCLEHVTGDWVFFLDSDQYLSRETRGNLRDVVMDLEGMGADVAELLVRNVDEDYTPLDIPEGRMAQLFRNSPSRRYEDPIHEHLEYTGSKPETRCLVSGEKLCIQHKGYSPRRIRGKQDRNKQMLEEIERKGGKKKYLDYYLCTIYSDEGDYERAMLHARQAIEKNDLPGGDSLAPWRIWMYCLQALGREEGELEQLIRRGMEEQPKAPEFPANYGFLLAGRGDFAGAMEHLRRAEKLMEEFRKNYPMQDNTVYRSRKQLYHVMSDACLKAGQKDLAIHYANLEWEAMTPKEEKGDSAWIPPGSSTVVDFACGDGTTGAAFLRIRPGCHYIGVEEDAAFLRMAGKRLPDTIASSPADADLAGLGVDSVDCLLYHERALRALTAKVLRRHVEWLSPKGQALFLLDNIGYFRHVTKAFAGQASLSFGGSPDLEGLRRMIGRAGLRVLSVEPVYGKADEEEKKRPETRALLEAFASWCRSTGLKAGTDAWACKYVVRAARELPEKKILVQAVEGNAVVSGSVRVEEPCTFLQTDPRFSCQVTRRGIALHQEQGFAGRIVLRQSVRFQDAAAALKQISAMRQAGCLICYETDEHPLRYGEEHVRSWWLDLVGAHVIQVPTEPLAAVLRQYNPNVAVFRNELSELPPRRVYREDGPATLFFGALDREQEWQDILPALNDVLGEYGNRVRVRVISDRAFFDALRTDCKEFIGNEAFYGGRFVPRGVYGEVLGSADISLLPLRDTVFNRMKSDILFLESAARGAAVLASPVVYGETVRDGHTGFLYCSPLEFRQKLGTLIENRKLRREMADAAYGYVQGERMLSRHYGERMAFYEEALARKDELERGLTMRLVRIAKQWAAGREGT